MMASDSAFAGLSKIGIAIAAGLGVGLALGWQEYARTTQGVTENFSVTQAVDAGLAAASVNTEKEPPSTFPILEVIGGEVYNFGVSEPGVDLTHTFRVKNRGTAPLELRLQDVTCKCLTMGLGKDEVTTVPPGGEFDINLQFRSDKPSDAFVQKARIKTNDPHPNRNVLKLQVEGRIVSRINIRPEFIEAPEMMASFPSQFGFNVYTYKVDDRDPAELTVKEIKCDDPVLQERLTYDVVPLGADDLGAEYQAAGGYRVTATVPAGMPMENYNAEITVTMSDGSQCPVGLGLSVKAPVMVRAVSGQKPGVRFHEEAKFVEFGLVQRDNPTEIELLYVYRTNKKGDLEVSLGDVTPADAIQAEIVEVRRSASATLAKVKVSVRPDCPSVQLNGPKKDNMAKVTVLTDSEEAPEITYYISFSVQ